jgi:carbamoyl-phosphate synthase large subunit
MAKILVMGAGSAQSNGVINCLLGVRNPEEVIGAGSEPFDLVFASCVKKYLIPHSTSPKYKEVLLKLLDIEKPDFMHIQHDQELLIASAFRDEILSRGTKLFIPDHETIETCVNKYKTYLKFKEAGITVPKNIMINNENDLKEAFTELGNEDGKIWLRSTKIGGGGIGSLPTNDYEFAKHWIIKYDGWGKFIAAEMLTPDSVTWLSIWHEGELVVGQGRIRKGWTFAGMTVSGITGITKVGQTYSDEKVSQVAINSVKAVSEKPHAVYAVDMTHDKNGIPNPTEINIGRFFTTVQFFKEAGLNMPEIYKDIALYNKFPELDKKMNPLKDGLLWLRCMDKEPILTTLGEIYENIIHLAR